MREYIAAAFKGMLGATFLCHMWLFFDYQSDRPRQPQLVLGQVYPLSNHGAIVYLTNVEATGLALLFGAFFTGSCLMVMAGLREEYVSGVRISIGIDSPSRKQIFAALGAGACYLAIIAIWGHQIAAFVVSRGIILSLG